MGQTPRSFARFKRFVIAHADDVFDVIAHRRTRRLPHFCSLSINR